MIKLVYKDFNHYSVFYMFKELVKRLHMLSGDMDIGFCTNISGFWHSLRVLEYVPKDKAGLLWIYTKI